MIYSNLVPRASDPRDGTRGSGIIRCRKPGIMAKIELRIPFQRPIRFLPETDYPRASRSFPIRIAVSGNEIGYIVISLFSTSPSPPPALSCKQLMCKIVNVKVLYLKDNYDILMKITVTRCCIFKENMTCKQIL